MAIAKTYSASYVKILMDKTKQIKPQAAIYIQSIEEHGILWKSLQWLGSYSSTTIWDCDKQHKWICKQYVCWGSQQPSLDGYTWALLGESHVEPYLQIASKVFEKRWKWTCAASGETSQGKVGESGRQISAGGWGELRKFWGHFSRVWRSWGQQEQRRWCNCGCWCDKASADSSHGQSWPAMVHLRHMLGLYVPLPTRHYCV